MKYSRDAYHLIESILYMFHIDLITTDATTSYFQRRHYIPDKQHYDGCLCFRGADLRFYFDTLDPTLLFSCNLAGFLWLLRFRTFISKVLREKPIFNRDSVRVQRRGGPSNYILPPFHSHGSSKSLQLRG